MSDLHTIPAERLDAEDTLRGFRDQFLIPRHGDGEQAYFCGNSLGLQPRGVREALLQELDDWAALGVEAHFHGKHPWMPYHNEVRDGLARIAGAQPSEVVAMNSLTANLHLMLVSFFLLTDPQFAEAVARGESGREVSFPWYLGFGAMIYVPWVAMSGVGGALGSVIGKMI